MNERFENIDQFLKDELENFSPEVPVFAWDNISQKLNNKSTKKPVAFYYKIAAGIALFLSAGSLITFLLTDNNKVPVNNNVAQTEQTEVSTNEVATVHATQENMESVVAVQNTIQNNTVKENSTSSITVAESGTSLIAYTVPNENTREEFTSKRVRNIDGIIPLQDREETLVIRAVTASPKDEYLAFEEFAEYEEVVFDKKAKKSKWMVGGQAGPQYSYREISSPNISDELLSRYNDKEEGLMAYAGGVNVEYSPVKRLSIQSGIYYSKMGQTKPAELQAPNNSVSHGQRWNPNYTENESVTYKVTNSTGNIVFTNVSTPTLSNKSNQMDVAVDKPTMAEASNMVSESISLSQFFEYIEVPIIARYAIIDKKFGIHLLGGISTNFLVGNSVYLDNQPGDAAGHTEGVAPINYSSTVGFGLGYAMGSNLKFTIEPQLKYYLSNQLSDPNINVNPYTIGVMTGVKYLF